MGKSLTEYHFEEEIEHSEIKHHSTGKNQYLSEIKAPGPSSGEEEYCGKNRYENNGLRNRTTKLFATCFDADG